MDRQPLAQTSISPAVYLSFEFLNTFTDVARTTLAGRLFQVLTTRWLKKNLCPINCMLAYVLAYLLTERVIWSVHRTIIVYNSMGLCRGVVWAGQHCTHVAVRRRRPRRRRAPVSVHPARLPRLRRHGGTAAVRRSQRQAEHFRRRRRRRRCWWNDSS